MTASEYAKRRGCSRQYISKLIKTGKLTMMDGQIDPILADAELELARAHTHGPKGTSVGSAKAMDEQRRAITRCANARAEALERENRTKAGKLVDAEAVEKMMSQVLGILRDYMLRLAPILTARYDGPRDRALYQWDVSEYINEGLHDCQGALMQDPNWPPYERRRPGAPRLEKSNGKEAWEGQADKETGTGA